MVGTTWTTSLARLQIFRLGHVLLPKYFSKLPTDVCVKCNKTWTSCDVQQGVIEADLAINTYAAPEDRERIRIAVTETGVIDWRNKYFTSSACLHGAQHCDVMHIAVYASSKNCLAGSGMYCKFRLKEL